MPKIQIKRGSKAKLPTLAPGEFGLATDAGELYIGGAGKNLHIPVLGDDGTLPPRSCRRWTMTRRAARRRCRRP